MFIANTEWVHTPEESKNGEGNPEGEDYEQIGREIFDFRFG